MTKFAQKFVSADNFVPLMGDSGLNQHILYIYELQLKFLKFFKNPKFSRFSPRKTELRNFTQYQTLEKIRTLFKKYNIFIKFAQTIARQ